MGPLVTREHRDRVASYVERGVQEGAELVVEPIPVPLSFYSFGGWEDSLLGDHGVYGPDSVHFYTRQKVVISRWPTPEERGLAFGFPQHG